MNLNDEITKEQQQPKEQKPQEPKEEPTRQYQKKSKDPIFDIKKTTTTLFGEEDYEIFFRA